MTWIVKPTIGSEGGLLGTCCIIRICFTYCRLQNCPQNYFCPDYQCPPRIESPAPTAG